MLTVFLPYVSYQINGPIIDKISSTKDGCMDVLLMKIGRASCRERVSDTV